MESIDDNEELEFTDAAFDTLGFSLGEKQNAYKITAAIMHLVIKTLRLKQRKLQNLADKAIYFNSSRICETHSCLITSRGR